jgi:hypothetical protein
VQGEKKRTALYMDSADYVIFEEFAEAKNVSFNKVAIYLMRLGLQSLAEKAKAKKKG